MIDPTVKAQYIPTIGIECHVQLKTKTKLFAAVGNDARDADPNTLISFICLGMPGALPVLNEAAITLAMRAAFAFNTKPQKYSYFERKHYFYPDLPKGYQITQLSHPIIKGGYVQFEIDGHPKKIMLNRVQLEEDAGKSTHPAGKEYSLVDLNRAGTPLLEIVSEPDMHTAEEAKAYVRELYLLIRYADVSDADLYHGNMRFDVNVSVSKDPRKFGLRTETKNLNSFRSVEKAVEFEINRQIELLEKGEQIVQETRGWDDAKQKTFSQRTKEDAHDYRYFPEPDVPPVELRDEEIAAAEQAMPTLPGEWRARLAGLGLTSVAVETLLDAEIENNQVEYLSLIQATLSEPELARFIATWEINVEIPWRAEGIENTFMGLKTQDRLRYYQDIYRLFTGGKLNSSSAKKLLYKLTTELNVVADVEVFAKEQGLIQVSDEAEIAKIVEQVLAENSKAAEDVKNGEMKAIGFLVGQVMKLSQGKANPGVAGELIRKQLGL